MGNANAFQSREFRQQYWFKEGRKHVCLNKGFAVGLMPCLSRSIRSDVIHTTECEDCVCMMPCRANVLSEHQVYRIRR